MTFVLESEKVMVPNGHKHGNTLDGFREEIDEYYKEIARFAQMPMTEVFQRIAGYTARMSHVRVMIQRAQESRPLLKFRTQELDPFIDEVDRQFRVWSRIVTIQDQELRSNGAL